MKQLRNKKGITLIALVITIIVMLILVAVTIKLAIDSGLFDYSKKAASEFNNTKQQELQAVDDWMQFIDISVNDGWQTAWEGSQTSENGQLVLPISLNDCSNIYKIQVESSKYTGQAILNVYSLETGVYIGRISVDDSSAYIWNLRNFSNGALNVEGISTINYQGNKNSSTNTDTSTLNFDTNDFDSEIVITKIAKKEKQYSLMGNLILKLRRNENITANDIVPFIDYALNYGDLGYSYVNADIEPTDMGMQINAEKVTFNENLERQLLTDIKTNRIGEIRTLEKPIRDNIISAFQNDIFNTRLMRADMYTQADYLEENPYLVEFCNKFIGNTIVPFMLTYLKDICLADLNQDGYVISADASGFDIVYENGEEPSDNLAIKKVYLYNINEYAGLCCRFYADMYSVGNKHYNESMNQEEEALINEIRNSGPMAYYYSIKYWTTVYDCYKAQNLNNIYTALHNNNITIKMSGLRLGYYLKILPQLSQMLQARGFNFNDTYVISQDTEYVEDQGITQYLNML